jgi:HSP20 family molecular chaperone IbpA
MSLFPSFGREFRPFFQLLDDYDRATRQLTREFDVSTFTPKADVREDKDSYNIHLEVPGIPQDRISVEWQDANTLTISGSTEQRSERGERPQGFVEGESKEKAHQPSVEDEPETGEASKSTEVATAGKKEVGRPTESKWWVSERSYGSFSRSFTFPTRVDQDAVKAKLNNGVLDITVPKQLKATHKKTITIE